ncbi:unnamed protein product [Pleuronectes platessa]|uniref:Uncharacterized protein n=1 Tax=Pleuronectes platessa TaxID=8262 RepID=A0A9N7YFU1_PLEPL|nr:unnamed protein product [Pleuronectes platessa]
MSRCVQDNVKGLFGSPAASTEHASAGSRSTTRPVLKTKPLGPRRAVSQGFAADRKTPDLCHAGGEWVSCSLLLDDLGSECEGVYVPRSCLLKSSSPLSSNRVKNREEAEKGPVARKSSE